MKLIDLINENVDYMENFLKENNIPYKKHMSLKRLKVYVISELHNYRMYKNISENKNIIIEEI